MGVRVMTVQVEADTCTCFLVDPKYWFTHYGAVEPGSMYEPNPDCMEHFPKRETRVEWFGRLQVHQPVPAPKPQENTK